MTADDQWMIRAAVEAAPPLSVDTIDSLRRVLAPKAQSVSPTVRRLPTSVGSRRALPVHTEGRQAA